MYTKNAWNTCIAYAHQTFDVKVFPNSNVQVTIKILLVYILLTTLLNNNAKPSRDLYGKV